MISRKEERRTTVENAVKLIEKDFGVGSIMRLGDHADKNIDAISTGILSLDDILGVGGLPCGRIVEIYGPKDNGRSASSKRRTPEVKDNSFCGTDPQSHRIDISHHKLEIEKSTSEP